MKIYVIAAMHGNEKFGLKVLGYLDFNSPDMRIRVGNPEAIAKNKRYIESDLNRSFRRNEKTREARIADLIQKEIEDFAPDYVIDIHTSITDVGKVAIVAQYNKKTCFLAQALSLDNIVIMPPRFTKNSLIGCLPDRSISLELGSGIRSDKLAEKIANAIASLPDAEPDVKTKLPVFEVTGTIDKSYKHMDKVTNLRFDPDLNAYPFLASSRSYQDMGGFMAVKKMV